ncbi:MFS transporter, SP family, general alpha glucoside:H+ symporter, partial [Phenoliferia sp. Uapishka_3]
MDHSLPAIPPRLPKVSLGTYTLFAPGDLEAGLPLVPPPAYSGAGSRRSRSSIANSFRSSLASVRFIAHGSPHRGSRASSMSRGSGADSGYESDAMALQSLEFKIELSAAIREIHLLKNNLTALHVLIDSVQQEGPSRFGQALASLTTESGTRLQTIFAALRKLSGSAVSQRSQEQLAEGLRLFKECLEELRVGEWKELNRNEEIRRRLAHRVRKSNMSKKDLSDLLDRVEVDGKAPVGTLKLDSPAGIWALEHPFAQIRSTIQGADAFFLAVSTDYDSKEFTRPKSWQKRVSHSNKTSKNVAHRQSDPAEYFCALARAGETKSAEASHLGDIDPVGPSTACSAWVPSRLFLSHSNHNLTTNLTFESLVRQVLYKELVPTKSRQRGKLDFPMAPTAERLLVSSSMAGSLRGSATGRLLWVASFVVSPIPPWIPKRFLLTWFGRAVIGFVSISFTAPNVQTLQVFEVLCGIPWGVFQTLTITYASEVCPVALRGYLTTYVNFCWGLGQVIGIGVIKSMIGRTDQWAYRIPFALQWMWPVPLFIGVFLAPESPWWLVRHSRLEEAKHNLLRLTSVDKSAETGFDADETIQMMVVTTKLEERITSGAGYLDCFRGTDLRRTEIVCMCWAIQNLCGNSFSGYSSYFFVQAGLASSTSYDFALGQYGINMAGVFGAWFLMSRGIGRRTLYLYGQCGLCIILLLMGFLGLVPHAHKEAAALATASLMLVWALIYQCTVGTVAYSLVGELSSRRLLIKSVVLGRNLYNIVGIACSVLTPYMLNPSAWNWGNYAGFFWGGSAFLCIIYTYFRIPEPAGRSFAELDLLFEKKVSARNFAKTKVDVFYGVEKTEPAIASGGEKNGLAFV